LPATSFIRSLLDPSVPRARADGFCITPGF
jgi:hypothetical protein